MRRLDAQPLTVQVPNPAGGPTIPVVLDGYKMANLLNVLALNPGSLTSAPAMLHALATGNPAPAAQALLQTISPPGLNGYGLQFGVVCREHIAFTNPAKMLAEAKRALPDLPDRVLAAPPQVPRIFPDCAIWNAGHADPAAAQATRRDIPVLLLNGTLDGITPPAWAETAAAGLTNSTLLLFPGAGHDVIQWNGCAIRVMLNFLNNPTGDHDAGCVKQVAIPPFTTTA